MAFQKNDQKLYDVNPMPSFICMSTHTLSPHGANVVVLLLEDISSVQQSCSDVMLARNFSMPSLF